ncbi:MAG: S-methyl-5-thioribose-1-phosphate isomerase [Cyclobacteriaceae bacterium]|nr:S-methyl-5-thioribose-1-phosphate isomerase [Cyclobacteriaceae bacterium]
MKVQNKHYRTIWLHPDDQHIIQIIDQRRLPFQFIVEDLHNLDEMAVAIKDMHVRGAGLIGAAAGYGMYLASLEAVDATYTEDVMNSGKFLKATRPTAVNLQWAVDRQLELLNNCNSLEEYRYNSLQLAETIADEDVAMCKSIGVHGLKLIEEISKKKHGKTVNILTHCNAGWLAFTDYGSATSPIYLAYDKGIKVHVWVDETRPRNQGARLTAWELGSHGVPHTVIPDNAGGHLMQHGMVDLVITGADRVTASGDAANKIGTYLKALAAKDNQVPFYVALPSSTFDWEMTDGIREIPIEQRDAHEMKYMEGLLPDGSINEIQIIPDLHVVANYGFDVTPARLITGLITERGICEADRESIRQLFPENF